MHLAVMLLERTQSLLSISIFNFLTLSLVQILESYELVHFLSFSVLWIQDPLLLLTI